MDAGAAAEAARSTAGRALAHVAQLVEFFGGSRVEDYQLLFELVFYAVSMVPTRVPKHHVLLNSLLYSREEERRRRRLRRRAR